MITILWVSRHTPLPSQTAELKELFGQDCKIIIDHRPFSSAKQIKDRFYKAKAHEMVLIAPLSVCRVILDMGIRPLWSEMKKVDCSSSEVEVRSKGTLDAVDGEARCYKFVRFKRLMGFGIQLEELKGYHNESVRE